ncbi:MAG: polymer-forming cytoskeletal protein [Rhodospirillales bacterium]
MRRNQGEDDATAQPGDPRPPNGEAALLKRPPRRSFRMPAEPAGGAGFHPDVPRRAQDASSPPDDPRADGIDGRTLVVGRDIRLKGEIAACEQVIVEGQIEVSLTGVRRLEVGATGVFRGGAEVAEAVIAGRFEGQLTARDRLTVRAGGRIDGRIRYGTLAVEAGGTIAGEVEPLRSDQPLTVVGDGPARASADTIGRGPHPTPDDGEGRPDVSRG